MLFAKKSSHCFFFTSVFSLIASSIHPILKLCMDCNQERTAQDERLFFFRTTLHLYVGTLSLHFLERLGGSSFLPSFLTYLHIRYCIIYNFMYVPTHLSTTIPPVPTHSCDSNQHTWALTPDDSLPSFAPCNVFTLRVHHFPSYPYPRNHAQHY